VIQIETDSHNYHMEDMQIEDDLYFADHLLSADDSCDIYEYQMIHRIQIIFELGLDSR